MTSAWDMAAALDWSSSGQRTPTSPPTTLSASFPSTSPLALSLARRASSHQPFDRSWALLARTETPPSPPVTLPILPPELLRRIIRLALALPPSLPDKLGPTSQPSPEWDACAGRAARRNLSAREVQREGVAKTARALLGVCRAWKPLVLRYMYAEPHVTGHNVAALAHAVVLGDRKWSDLNLHPHSYPGRWITVLDLSNLGSSYGSDAATIARATATLLDLAPCVKHLRLPPSGVSLVDLRHAPCIRTLRALEGVHLPNAEVEVDAVRLLRVARSLEVLSLVWVNRDEPPEDTDADADDVDPPPPLSLTLPRLHTVTLEGGPPGPLLAALTLADLPALTRLVLSPYEPRLYAFDDDPWRGGRRAFQAAHGAQILSLTYVSTPDWPRRDVLPPVDTLALHPALVHLHLALPHALLNDNPDLAAVFASTHHPLAAVTVPRWPRVARIDSSVSPHPQIADPPTPPGIPPAPTGHRFLAALFSKPSRIRSVSVEGFTWVPPELGRWAAESGDSGMMRSWAGWLARQKVELRDTEGNTAPPIERGRAAFGAGRMSVDGGRRSVDGGRRSFDGRRGGGGW